MKIQYRSTLLFGVLTTLLLIGGFQNCSGTGFALDSQVGANALKTQALTQDDVSALDRKKPDDDKNSADNKSDKKEEAQDRKESRETHRESRHQRQPSSPSTPTPSRPETEAPLPITPNEPVETGNQLFNFVGGSQSVCEASITSRLGIEATCEVGGGCGMTCGVPNGTSCVSANPTAYGACIQVSFGTNTVGGTRSQFYNFLGEDLASCGTSMIFRLGVNNGSCTLGGGCAENGLPPTAENPSANPSLYGACVQAFIKLQEPIAAQ